MHTNKKIRGVVNTCPRATLKHRIFGKTQKKNLAKLNSTTNNRFN